MKLNENSVTDFLDFKLNVERSVMLSLDVSPFEVMEIFDKAREIEQTQKIQAQIEILYSISNNGANAPLYDILKTTLLDLQEQLKQQEQ